MNTAVRTVTVIPPSINPMTHLTNAPLYKLRVGANLLRLKPCIQVKNGKMDVAKKYRGKYDEVLKQYIREIRNGHL